MSVVEEIAGGEAVKSRLGQRVVTSVFVNGARVLLPRVLDGSILVEMPDGRQVRLGRKSQRSEPVVRLKRSGLLRRVISQGPIGFAEGYMAGDFDCSDLAGLFGFFLRNRDSFKAHGRHLFKVRLPDRLRHFSRRNSIAGSRRNISEHYDLGNDFYRPWLDANMQYSSAIFDNWTQSLGAAQRNKLERILSMLGPEACGSILEIGCGWGGFARLAASEHGARVTGLTLSHEQASLARQLARQIGVADLCTFEQTDYRNSTGEHDAVVSIEMIEAVGEAYWETYFQTVADRLRLDGVAVIQAITIDPARFDSYRRKVDFIQRHVFPGGMLPTVPIMKDIASRFGLVLEVQDCFGASYAETLRRWRERFERAWPSIRDLGFDERFKRKWIYYLTYCEAGFDAGVVDVGLYRFRKTG